ncbi:MAG: hypothetical protein ACJAS1_004039, partial [Oleiphilaceae bacterium]
MGSDPLFPLFPPYFPIILILRSTVNRLRDELTVSNSIAAQFIGHNLPW